jgi:hypothetical protein
VLFKISICNFLASRKKIKTKFSALQDFDGCEVWRMLGCRERRSALKRKSGFRVKNFVPAAPARRSEDLERVCCCKNIFQKAGQMLF